MSVFENYSDSLLACQTVKLAGFAKANNIQCNLLAYLDFGGVTGSYTDALAYGMLALAREKAELRAGGAVIEATGGSFGVSLAAACASQGHQLYLVLPAEVSIERQRAIKAFGAKISLVGGGAAAMLQKALASAQELRAYFINYMSNDLNCEFHRRITGPSIMRSCAELDAIIIGVGSGGTVSGVGESVKAWYPDCKIVAVEPYECQALLGGIVGRHGIAGIGAGFVPENYNKHIVDKIIAVSTQNAVEAAKQAQQLDFLPATAACGAVLCAAKSFYEKNPDAKNILCVFPSRNIII